MEIFMTQPLGLEPNDEEKTEQLPQDYSTPFSPPSGVADNTDDTHPQADTNVDAQEHYDEGIAGAIGLDQRGSQGILGYTPPDKSEESKEN
jgi:hypothetical protein